MPDNKSQLIVRKTNSAQRPLVLIADDDDPSRLVLGEVMNQAGFDVLEARDGSACLDLFSRHTPSLVLLDVVMPGLNGYDTCRRLRSTKRGRSTPIVIMTSHADLESVDEAFLAGATDFISKPINYGVLPHRLKFILRARHTLEELTEARAHLADAQRVARLGNWFLDIEAGRVNLSAEAMQLLRLEAPSVSVDTLINRFHREDRVEISQAFHSGFQLRAFNVEGRLLTDEDDERVIFFRAERVPGTTLQPHANVAGTVQDLTEQRQSERLQLQLSVLGYTVSVTAGSADFDSLTEETLRRLVSALRVRRAALLLIHNDRTEMVGLARATGATITVDAAEVCTPSAEEEELIRRSRVSTENTSLTTEGWHHVLVPMTLRGKVIGGVSVACEVSTSTLNGPTLFFLETVASQLAVAVDRARLASEERRWQEREQRRLRAEVESLRQARRDVEFVYRSPEMSKIVSVLSRVGPTEASVLVTGESGTGKELVAKAVHFMSPRKDKKLVIVDCASIPSTLLESELFGYEKGAYTGANQKKAGRVADADGGTLILDEIGELALELQSKLLRFVQEKHFTPLGGTKPRHVDVRLVAVTNRDLAHEVAQKRFREDLFYRLNVVRLHVPPLRERTGDVVHLAEHFAQKHSLHYDKGGIKHFSPEAIASIEKYSWPGNVRELQNRVMRAVILSEQEVMTTEDLEIVTEPAVVTQHTSPITTLGSLAAFPGADEPASAQSASNQDPWDELFTLVGDYVEELLAARPRHLRPVGRWLEEDVVALALELSNGVQAQGARLAGLPEATFRRRLNRTPTEARPNRWPPICEAVRAVLSMVGASSDTDLIWEIRLRLVGLLELRSNNSPRTAASLLGISVPTYRRWRRQMESEKKVEAGKEKVTA